MISQRCPEFQKQWGRSGATEGGRELILAVSLHSLASLHYIISKRPCVPSYHLRQDCTRILGVQLPLRTLSLSLFLSSFLLLPLSWHPLAPCRSFSLARSFHLRSMRELRCTLPPCASFSSLTTTFAFTRRKRDRWMNRRCAQGSGTSMRRTPATGFGGQTGDRENRESRPTIHFYPALFFSSLFTAGSGANQNTLRSDAPPIVPGKDKSQKRIRETADFVPSLSKMINLFRWSSTWSTYDSQNKKKKT